MSFACVMRLLSGLRPRLLWPALFMPLATAGQMIPDAPILHFRLPMFGEQGYKTWELRGVEGIYVNEDEAIVNGLDLLVFSGDASLWLENRIRSPQARIHFGASRATGAGSLFVSGAAFTIEGSDWEWDGVARRIVVRRQARVVFEDELDILR